MKKFVAFLLSFILFVSFTTTAFADIALDSLEIIESDSAETPATELKPDDNNLLMQEILDDINKLEESVEVLENEVNTNGESNNVDVSATEDVTSEEETEINPELSGEGDMIFTNVSLYSVAPIEPDDTSGFKSVMLELIGPYDPVVVEYEYQNSNNYSSYLREVLPDYPWFASCAVFALVVYCVFRLGGVMFGNL